MQSPVPIDQLASRCSKARQECVVKAVVEVYPAGVALAEVYRRLRALPGHYDMIWTDLRHAIDSTRGRLVPHGWTVVRERVVAAESGGVTLRLMTLADFQKAIAT